MILFPCPALILPPEKPAIVRASDLSGLPTWEEMERRKNKATFPFPVFCPGSAALAPPSTGLWAWYDAAYSYTETSSTPTTLITSDGTATGSGFDRSGGGHHVYQTSGAAKPTFKTNIINGLPVWRFATASSQFLTAAAVPSHTVVIYCVINPTTWANLRGIVGVGGDNSNPRAVLNQSSTGGGASPRIALFNGGYGAVSDQATLTNAHLIAASIGAASSTLKVDNNSDITAAVAGGGAGSNTELGSNTGNSGYFNGDIAEVLIYTATTHNFASGDGLLARQYLNTKYNLGLGI